MSLKLETSAPSIFNRPILANKFGTSYCRASTWTYPPEEDAKTDSSLSQINTSFVVDPVVDPVRFGRQIQCLPKGRAKPLCSSSLVLQNRWSLTRTLTSLSLVATRTRRPSDQCVRLLSLRGDVFVLSDSGVKGAQCFRKLLVANRWFRSRPR